MFFKILIYSCTQGGEGVKGVRNIKVEPPSKCFTELVTKNAIETKKGVPSSQIFTTLKYTPPRKL